MGIYRSIAELVGHTPLLALQSLGVEQSLQAVILAKLEYFNPAGSAKDRAALSMILDAEKRGILRPGAAIIEPTSGNTGIALAAIAIPRGYRVILTMPDTMSLERRSLLQAYGAELILTNGALGMQGAIDRAEALQKEIPGSIIAGQFTNSANPEAHYRTTGPEIWEDTGGKVDIFVAGVGTGGTLSGVGRYLKERNPRIRVVAVEPTGSPVLSGGQPGSHGLQGIGGGFIPDTLDTGIYDEVVTVTEADAYAAARCLARTEGILAGISSGAALWAAIEISGRPKNRGKAIVVLLPDTGDRYLSTPLFLKRK